MVIKQYHSNIVLTIAVYLQFISSATCANTVPAQRNVNKTTNYIESIDTVWIEDTVWIQDSVQISHSVPSLVIDTIQTTQDSGTLTDHDTSEIETISTITVYGKRTTGKDETVKPLVIGGKQLRETSRSTPLEELSQESGDIYVTSKGTGLHGVSSGASGGIYIRGLGGSPNSQILVVEEGAPDYQGIFGHPIPDAFFPSLIDRVIVIKGGDGVLYGTNALGGVIIIEDRWPDSAGIQLENDVAYGVNNTFRERATLLCKHKMIDFTSAFSAFTTQGHYDGNDGNSLIGQLGARLRLAGSSALILRDKIVFVNGADPGPCFAPFSPRQGFEVLRNNLSLRFEKREALDLQAVAWLDLGEHRLWDSFFSRDYTGGATVECSKNLFNEKLRVITGVTGEHVDGVAYKRVLVNNESQIPPVEASSSLGVYSQITVTPCFGLTGIVGGRLHYSTRYGEVPVYKFGLHWKFRENFQLHSRFTKNFRQPTLRELYLPFPAANSDLKPETSMNFDAGADLIIGRAQINGTVFRSNVTEMIKYFGAYGGATVVNIDQLDIWGVEGNLTLEPLGPFSIFTSGSWQNIGHFTKQNPDAKINGRISYGYDKKKGRFECSLSGEWVHGLYMKNYSRDSLNDVFFLDGNIRYLTRSKGGVPLEPYCVIRNFLNSQYEYIKYYRMPGISYLIGLIIKV
jgi:outer membrane cobalamin receptor